MGNLDSRQKSYLHERFGKRVSFSRVERKLYGHDIATLPSLLKPLIGDTTPDAVLQPESEAELVELVRWAAENRIPLTPRGKASTGYGGVLPVKQGIVVDFYRMRQVKTIDSVGKTVTAQAGAVWEKVDRELAKHDLTLRLYPTSYPSSTVGGWLAQGGAGIGSYESGWLRDNIISARVVMPDASVREFAGSELDLVADAEGITGLISEATLRVQPLEQLEVVAVSFANAHQLQEFAASISARKLPVWSFLFTNPRMSQLKNQAPLREHQGRDDEERVTLPDAYMATIAFRLRHRPVMMAALPEMLKASHGEMLDRRIADHEWQNRFNLMVIKRLGPSVVPSEVVVPLSSLGDVMTEIESKIGQPIVKEGIIVCGNSATPEATLLGMIPSDQRKFNYNLVFGLSLTVMKIAEKHGGRPYTTGLYFAHRANQVLGKSRAARLEEFKKAVDPNGIMNPGKVIGSGGVGLFMKAGSVMEPLVRPFGNAVSLKPGERPARAVRDIPAEVAWYAYSCSQCGYCLEECDQFYGRGWESQSPRGKWYWLREYMEGREKWDQFMIDSILSCTTCELCNNRCSVSLPIEQSWMKLRGQLVNDKKKMSFPPFEIMAAALTKEGDIWAGYRKDRAAWFPSDLENKHGPRHPAKAVYFAGCTASYVEKDIGMASVRLLDAAGVDFTFLAEKESCCGTPMLVAGKWDVFEQVLRSNITAVKNAGADTVISSCPACDMMWRHVYPTWAKKLGIDYGITARHYSEVIAEKLQSGQFKFPENGHHKVTVTWHDSCHAGRVSKIYDPPREIIQAIPGANLVEMEFNREQAHCCGSVLTLIKEPVVAADIGGARLDEAKQAGAEKVLALCPCCEFQLRVSAEKKQSPIEVVDLARFAASALGYEFPNPNPEVQRQWAVFEAMIALMTPQGFAALMDTMWPETIAAMPFGMGKMMRVMGKIPGALNVMKPMFPVLFPRLLPMMMPKLMPVMLERVGKKIAMPDYMAEQMPELMPKVMNNLMPHMVGDLVPLVTQPMIGYLKGKRD